MSTPQAIVDAVLREVESALAVVDARGKAAIVFDVDGRLNTSINERETAFALIEKHERSRGSISSEDLDRARNIPSCKIVVFWFVGEHFGCVGYEPAWSVS